MSDTIASTSAAGLKDRLLAVLAGDRLVRNIGWYFLAEGAGRIGRLITTVVLARMLSPIDLGVAAMAVTCFELIRVVANNGVGQMVIRARPEDLDAVCNTARRANLIVCASTAVTHVVVGAIVAWLSGRPELFWMIGCLGGVYLMMVPGLMPIYLLLRASRIRATSTIALVQNLSDNALTIAFALTGFGAWSIILPRLINVPVFVLMARYYQTWKPNKAAGYSPVADLLRFALPVVGSELLSAARVNLDKILVWGLLGVEALGVYYFAFNAGIGFSLSLTNALNLSLYPELAQLAGKPRAMLHRFDRALVRTALPISCIIALQAAMTFVYVPIVFGARWQNAVELVSLLCVSAITKPFFDSSCQLLRAWGQPGSEMAASTVYTTITLTIFAAALSHGLANGVLMLAAFCFVLQLSFTLWARRALAAEAHMELPYRSALA